MNDRNRPILRCHILDTGYCTAYERHLISSGRWKRVRCHSIAALLCHPTHGWFLWDTGYAPRIFEATQGFPFRAYRWATPITAPQKLAVAYQLGRFGICQADIGCVLLSHFHADHIAGLLDFSSARLISTLEAWADVRHRSGFRALTRAFAPQLMPADFERRARLIESFSDAVVPPFGNAHDLFGDGSALLVRLPGHAAGQVGMLAQTELGRLFFAADSCWTLASVQKRAMPNRITRFIAEDWVMLRETIHNLADFAQANPEVAIIPSHCPTAFRSFVQREV